VAAAPAPAPAKASAPVADAAAPAAAPRAEATGSVGSSAAEGARAVAPAAPTPWRATPEAWIERIVKLRGEGRHTEADAELAALRSRHPDLRLPQAALPPSR